MKIETPDVILDKLAEITLFCIKNNDPENEGFGCQFFVRHEAHVRWFEVEVAHKHYSVKIFKQTHYYHPEKVDDLELWTNETLDCLDGMLRDLAKIAAGKFHVEHNIKLGK
jgi:hypothetical protein